jgi:hypothetical protein
MKITYMSSAEIAGREINVCISVDGRGGPPIKEFNQIFRWLRVAAKYSPTQCSQRLNIYIYFTDLQKKLPTAPGKYIGPDNVNTAYTTSCVRGAGAPAEIHLFRREEWFKVLIHESFHVLGLDFSEKHEESIAAGKKYLETPATKNCNWFIFETYTELIAELLAIGFSRGGNLRAADIKKEKMFSAGQSNKLLEYMGMTYDDIWGGRGKWREKTPAFCYYVLKTILFVHLSEFLEWCKIHNKNTLCMRNINPDLFARFIREHAQSADVKWAFKNYGEHDGSPNLKMTRGTY